MPQYIAHKPRRASDENWVLSAVSISLVAVLCMEQTLSDNAGDL